MEKIDIFLNGSIMLKNNIFPFVFFFIDDVMPACFGQENGTTFRSFLFDETPVAKKTYDSLRQSFQKNKEEFSSFDRFYSELRQVRCREEFFTQRFIGKNKKAHTRNKSVEFVFSEDGRVDAYIIQKDGIRCVFILDVRISNHSDKSDESVHAINDMLAKRIISALDTRSIYKTKERALKDSIFREGLIAYQNELLETRNTQESKFEILLNTVENLIFLNKEVEAKVALFYDKLTAESDFSNKDEEEKFYKFIEEKLASLDIREYQRELFKKLYEYDAYGSNNRDSLAASFNKIKMGKQLSFDFLTQVYAIFSTGDDKLENVINAFRIFNKIPASHLYILNDALSDFEFDEDAVFREKQMAYFLQKLSQLSNNSDKDIFSDFQALLNEVCKKNDILPADMEGLSVDLVKSDVAKDNITDLFSLSPEDLSKPKYMDKTVLTLMRIIVEKTPKVKSLLSDTDETLDDENCLAYQWLLDGEAEDSLADLFKNFVFSKKLDLEEKICDAYPFLKEFIQQIKRGDNFPNSSLYTVCRLFKNYETEEEYDEAFNRLKQLSEQERILLKVYHTSLVKSLSAVSNNILNALALIEQEELLERSKKNKKKLKQPSENKAVLSEKEVQHKNFMSAFADFYADTENSAKVRILKESIESLDKSVFKKFRGLPKDSPVSVFINKYILLQEEGDENSFEKALTEVILYKYEGKKQKLIALTTSFFDNIQDEVALKELKNFCASLTKKDLDYLLNSQNEKNNNPKSYHFFLSLFLKNTSKKTEAFFADSYAQFKAFNEEEQKRRIDFFKSALIAGCTIEEEKDILELKKACLRLTKQDVEALLDEKFGQLNEVEKLLLPSLLSLKEKATKNTDEATYNLLLKIRRLTIFQTAVYRFFNNLQHEGYQDNLVQLATHMSGEDFDIFAGVYQHDKILTRFFAKLRQNNKSQTPAEYKEGIKNIVEHTKNKFVLNHALSMFLEDDFCGIEPVLSTEFLKVAEKGYSDLSDIIDRQQERELATFFVENMKQIKDRSMPEQVQKNLEDFLNEKGWLIDIFQFLKFSQEERDSYFKRISQNENAADYNSVIRTIDKNIKVRLALLDLEFVEELDSSDLIPERCFVSREIKKELFCKMVDKFWNTSKDDAVSKKISAMYLKLDDLDLLDEIVNESEFLDPVSVLITTIQDSLVDDKNRPTNSKSLRKKKGDKAFRDFVEYKIFTLTAHRSMDKMGVFNAWLNKQKNTRK